jgi:tRNA A37 threonylcarbamoyladenosine biosynthesis protein TsaE
MPQLFVYAESEDGTERMFLVDAYMVKGSGEVELFRNGMDEAVTILQPSHVAGNFFVLEWDEELSTHYNEDDFELKLEEDGEGDVYLNVILPTVH